MIKTQFYRRFYQNLSNDTRHFLRSPGLVVTTSVAFVLLLFFIVLPVWSVLNKSLTVSSPTVTVSFPKTTPNRTNSGEMLTEAIRDAIKTVEGIEEIRVIAEIRHRFIVARFNKNWDEYRAIYDTRRTVKKTIKELNLFVEDIEIKLGKERYRSFATFAEFFSKARHYRALRNSIIVGLITTVLICIIAFIFAYLTVRGPHLMRKPLKALAILPRIAPPFIFSLSLILILGRNGIITKTFNLAINIYGWPGVIIAQVIAFLPLGYLMIENVLRSLDSSLDDTARDMGATEQRVLFKITLPLVSNGIFKAALLVFILSIADFANPMLIGGDVPFLATSAFLLWIGEGNLEMSAVLCVFLLAPSLIAFSIHEYAMKGKTYVTLGGKPTQAEYRKISPRIFYTIMPVAVFVSISIVVCFCVIFAGAITKILMVDNTFTLEHFTSVNGIRSLANSLRFSLGAALIATPIGIILSYMLMRKRIPLKKVLEFVALIGFGVPGTVIGLGYILFFNSPPLKLTGTFAIMMINEAFRNLSVGLEAGISKLQQIDVAIEEAAMDMGASAPRIFIKVIFPLIISAVAVGFVYTFMVAMIAVSAVIFLVTPGKNLISLYILAVTEIGEIGMACGLSVMLIFTVVLCLGALSLMLRYSRFTMTLRGV